MLHGLNYAYSQNKTFEKYDIIPTTDMSCTHRTPHHHKQNQSFKIRFVQKLTIDLKHCEAEQVMDAFGL